MKLLKVKIERVAEPGQFWNYLFEGSTDAEVHAKADALIALQMAKPGRGTATKIAPSDDPAWSLEILQEKRRNELPPDHEILEALREFIAEGRREKLDIIQAKVDAVKIKYPKN